jgi:uncharacterized damage-inducible protein DinB
MAWANQEIFKKISELPDEALDAYLVNPQWTVREIARHIASSATYYGWRLLDRSAFTKEENDIWQERLHETELPPLTMKDMQVLITRAANADAVLLAQSKLPEGVVLQEVEGQTITRARSTLIFQSIHHATEHRAQLVDALEACGFSKINLDEYDLWAFCHIFGE